MPATLEQDYHEAVSTHLERRTMTRTIPELKSREELAAVTLLDALDVDERPSFAIHVQHTLDFDFDFDANAPLELEYSNAAFTRIDGLLARVTGKLAAGSVFVEHGGPQMAFRKWLQGAQDDLDLAQRGKSYMFDGLIWTAVTVDALKIVSGLHASLLWPNASPVKHLGPSRNMPVQGRPPVLSPSPGLQDITSGYSPGSEPSRKHGPYDVTLQDPPVSILSDHIKHVRSTDWAQTPLGSMEKWPPELRTVVNVCLNNNNPCVLFWGEEVTMCYNEAYVQLIGLMHPIAMGSSVRKVASQYWHTFQPLIDRINTTGQSVCESEVPIFIDRHGFLEETYWSFQFIPILDKDGCVAGYLNPLFETTR
jgi:hypothetical protein